MGRGLSELQTNILSWLSLLDDGEYAHWSKRPAFHDGSKRVQHEWRTWKYISDETQAQKVAVCKSKTRLLVRGLIERKYRKWGKGFSMKFELVDEPQGTNQELIRLSEEGYRLMLAGRPGIVTQ